MTDQTGSAVLIGAVCSEATSRRQREMSPCPVDGRAEGVGMNWQPLIEFLVSVGYGLLSSIVPIFNSEIYIVASQVVGSPKR